MASPYAKVAARLRTLAARPAKLACGVCGTTHKPTALSAVELARWVLTGSGPRAQRLFAGPRIFSSKGTR